MLLLGGGGGGVPTKNGRLTPPPLLLTFTLVLVLFDAGCLALTCHTQDRSWSKCNPEKEKRKCMELCPPTEGSCFKFEFVHNDGKVMEQMGCIDLDHNRDKCWEGKVKKKNLTCFSTSEDLWEDAFANCQFEELGGGHRRSEDINEHGVEEKAGGKDDNNNTARSSVARTDSDKPLSVYVCTCNTNLCNDKCMACRPRGESGSKKKKVASSAPLHQGIPVVTTAAIGIFPLLSRRIA